MYTNAGNIQHVPQQGKEKLAKKRNFKILRESLEAQGPTLCFFCLDDLVKKSIGMV